MVGPLDPIAWRAQHRAALLAAEAEHWLVREILNNWKRVLKRVDVTSRTLVTLVEPGSCFAGTLLEVVLEALAARPGLPPPTLVLWGKIAQWLEGLPALAMFPKAMAEHPYNLSFIQNQPMQQLFGPMRLLQKAR